MTDTHNHDCPPILNVTEARRARIEARHIEDDTEARRIEIEARTARSFDYWHKVRPAFELAVERALDGIVEDMPARTFADYRRNMAVAVQELPGLLDAAMERACREGLPRWPMD